MMRFRSYGTAGPLVIVLHGGPAAAGSMAPVARGLAGSFRVVEPFQRSSTASVAGHVADLHDLIDSRCAAERPALVGHSWGAMLALAYAAAHHTCAGPLALVACGTFDLAARERMRAILEERMDDGLRRRLERLLEEFPDPNQRFQAMGSLTMPLYSCDLVTNRGEADLEIEECDARASQETWEDMVRLQQQGVYPAAFEAIKTPVLMLHGAVDPHPGRMILASLKPHLPQLEYYEWERCGHYPWLEGTVRDEFFSVLCAWLVRQLA